MKLSNRIPFFLVLATLAGCQPDAVSTSDGKPASTSAAKSTASVQLDDDLADPEDEVSVVVASWDEVQQMIAEHQGKVVVVDLWSTWCTPCIREFPNLVALHEKHADRVACMSVSLDYNGSESAPPESHRDTVLGFLSKQKATFQNVICSDPDLELYDRIDLGAIPAIYVYDKSGQMRKRFDNDSGEYGDEGFTYKDHVVPLVEQLLDE